MQVGKELSNMLVDKEKLPIHRYTNRRNVIYTGLDCDIPGYDIVVHGTQKKEA
jgi:hypothetical protein